MSKKILIDINSIIPSIVSGKTTGIGRTTLELVKNIAKLSEMWPHFKVILYSQNMRGVGGKQLRSYLKNLHFYLPNRTFINKCFQYLPVKEMISGYNLMHIPHNFDYVFSPAKTIFTLHDALFMRLNENSFDHLGMRKRVPVLMRKCKGIVTCSVSSKKDIIETMGIEPHKIDVVYWGIDHNLFNYNKDKEVVKDKIANLYGIKNSFFLSVSCNTERKNTHKLLEAYLQLSNNVPVNDLILVWSNPPKPILEKVEKSKMNHRVHFLSNISDEQLALLYNGATALIFPSSYEGFGLPVLEAMACGTPVVTCRNSSLVEVGGGAALYMDEPITESILHFLESFENSEFDISQQAIKGVEQASKFRWDTAAGEYLSLYKKYLEIDN